jgi:hypothetical protein
MMNLMMMMFDLIIVDEKNFHSFGCCTDYLGCCSNIVVAVIKVVLFNKANTEDNLVEEPQKRHTRLTLILHIHWITVIHCLTSIYHHLL